ncbi:cytochrome P450 [Lentinula edodes]|uniref:Cytochrome P450 n=1 Tax=Lentinula lateritia TaxID=40482 RepID=A0A9W9DUM2_9AGAR|nr:cytochrome P450 [Lentinula edodes]
MELFILLCIPFVLILLRVGLNSLRGVNKRLPPGPRGLPILGNIFQLGTGSQWLTFDQLKSRYGPIVYLNMAGQNIIVLNTKAAAIELLERRSVIYSDRPRFIVAEYLGSQSVMAFARYGRLWKAMRRAGHRVLHARASTKYQPVQIQESIILTHDLLCNTSSPLLTKIHNSASTMVSVLYGRNLLPSGNPVPSVDSASQPRLLAPHVCDTGTLRFTSDVLESLSNFTHRFTSAVYPGAHLVESVPILDYLPPAMVKWKREAQRDSQHITAMVEQYYNDAVRNDLQQATLCAGLATDQVATGLSDIENAWVAATLAAGALETTSISLSFFLYAMSQHQNVQQQAQIELDRVVGQSRTPNFVDMAQLPYVRAIVKEVLRWQPAVPLAVPHVVMEDDWYEGYFIPKGTTIIANVWSMNRDKDIYGPDADQFRPERFLQQHDSGMNAQIFTLRAEYEKDDGHSAYGFGRRVCVGRHVADNALFINICTILWALRIEPEPEIHANVGSREQVKDILNPMPDFQCRFLPRFPEAKQVLQHLRDEIV